MGSTIKSRVIRIDPLLIEEISLTSKKNNITKRLASREIALAFKKMKDRRFTREIQF